MKKLISLCIFILLLFTSCSSRGFTVPEKDLTISEKEMLRDLKEGISKIIVENKTKLFEVHDLLGKPDSQGLGKKISNAYYNGSFYWSNSPENREILKKYIPEYLFANPYILHNVRIGFSYNYADEDTGLHRYYDAVLEKISISKVRM